MFIRCWGARGSIAVSGPEYLKYGGDTTCLEIRTKNDEVIIVDAGTGIRRLGNELLNEGRQEYNIIFTHAHWDHILGFPFFRPIYAKGTRINFFGCPFAQQSVKELVAKSMKPPYFPVNFEDIKAEIEFRGACKESFAIDSVCVTPVLLSHPNQGLGYKFVEDGKSFVFLTDNELALKHPGGLDYRDYVDFCSHANLLMHDSEFTEKDYVLKKGWGHSTYSDALRLALDAGVKQFGLFHHNQDRTDTELDEIVEDCQNTIRCRKSDLACLGVRTGTEIEL